jgi:hypothetical protein
MDYLVLKNFIGICCYLALEWNTLLVFLDGTFPDSLPLNSYNMDPSVTHWTLIIH